MGNIIHKVYRCKTKELSKEFLQKCEERGYKMLTPPMRHIRLHKKCQYYLLEECWNFGSYIGIFNITKRSCMKHREKIFDYNQGDELEPSKEEVLQHLFKANESSEEFNRFIRRMDE